MTSKKDVFTIKLRLHPTTKEKPVLDKLFDNANQIFDAVEDEGEKRIRKLRNLGERIMLIERSKQLNKEAGKLRKRLKDSRMEEREKDDAALEYVKNRQEAYDVQIRLAEIKKENGFNKYSLQKFAHKIAAKLESPLPYDVVTNVSDEAWKALSKYFKGESKKLRRRSVKGQSTLWSKRPSSPFAIIDDSFLHVKELLVKIAESQSRSKDEWLEQAMALPTNRLGIKRETIAGKTVHSLLVEKVGKPPKRSEGDSLVAKSGKVLLDPGPSVLFEMSRDEDDKMIFRSYELCRGVDFRECEKAKIQEKMSRSLRKSNPQCFDDDGAVIKGSRFENKSHAYEKYKTELGEINFEIALQREESHDRLANLILSHGNHVVVDKTRWKALSARSKESKCKHDNGRIISKSRYGKSIGKRAPGSLLAKIEERTLWAGGDYVEIDPLLAKTSQYDHFTGEWKKIGLDVRWKKLGSKYWVQRDCYALFYMDHLLPIYDGDGKLVDYYVDRQGMFDDFEDFLEAQERFMKWVDEHGTGKIKEVTRRPKDMASDENGSI